MIRVNGAHFAEIEKTLLYISEARERAELEKADANMAPAPRGRPGGAPGAGAFAATPPENR